MENVELIISPELLTAYTIARNRGRGVQPMIKSGEGPMTTNLDRPISGNKTVEWLEHQGRNYNEQANKLQQSARGMVTLQVIDYRCRATECFTLAGRIKNEITSGRLDYWEQETK